MSDDTEIVETDNNEEESNPVVVSEILIDELKKFAQNENKDILLRKLRDAFVAKRIETNNIAERARQKVLEEIIQQIEQGKVSIAMLLRLLDQLNKAGTAEIGILTGAQPQGVGRAGGTTINLNQSIGSGAKPATPSQNEGGEALINPDTGAPTNPLQLTGQLVEALEHVARFAKDNPEEVAEVIDIEAVEVKDESDG